MLPGKRGNNFVKLREEDETPKRHNLPSYRNRPRSRSCIDLKSSGRKVQSPQKRKDSSDSFAAGIQISKPPNISAPSPRIRGRSYKLKTALKEKDGLHQDDNNIMHRLMTKQMMTTTRNDTGVENQAMKTAITSRTISEECVVTVSSDKESVLLLYREEHGQYPVQSTPGNQRQRKMSKDRNLFYKEACRERRGHQDFVEVYSEYDRQFAPEPFCTMAEKLTRAGVQLPFRQPDVDVKDSNSRLGYKSSSKDLFERRPSYDKLKVLQLRQSYQDYSALPVKQEVHCNTRKNPGVRADGDHDLHYFKTPGYCREITSSLINNYRSIDTMDTADQCEESESEKVPLTPELSLKEMGITESKPLAWDEIHLPNKIPLHVHLDKRIHSFKNTDTVVQIGHEEFHCHVMVLSCYSKYFDKNVKSHYILKEEEVTQRAFHIIYDWMIFPEKTILQLLDRKNILEVFMASQFLDIPELEEQCWAFIDSHLVFNEETAFLLYLEARRLNIQPVMQLMIQRVMKFFLTLVSSQDFLDLKVEELCVLLRSSYIAVNNEIEILLSAVRWLMHDWDVRRVYLLDVINCVRFGLIHPRSLVDIKRNPENPELLEIMSDPYVNQMREDGLSYSIVQYWHGKSDEEYYHWVDLLGLTEPEQRNWTGKHKSFVTYTEFLCFLEEIREHGFDAVLSSLEDNEVAHDYCEQLPLTEPHEPTLEETTTCGNVPTVKEFLMSRDTVSMDEEVPDETNYDNK